jgi:hypothetical protein
MFIIPCKFNPDTPVIFECIESIKIIYPNEKIVVVDSCSNDEYYKTLDVFDVILGNVNYECGAYTLAFEKYPDEDVYYCIHDSLMMISKCEFDRLKIVQHFAWSRQTIPVNTVPVTLSKAENILNFLIPDEVYGCFGNIFFCKNDVMKTTIEYIKNFLPTTKIESEITERLLGLLFTKLGFNLQSSSIQGQHVVQDSKYDESVVKKQFLRRQ